MTKGNEKTHVGSDQESALLQAYDLTSKASRLGFDWPDTAGILDKLDEELAELKEALDLEDRKKIEDELGDLLFVLVNVARFLRINPERALTKTISKFKRRFGYIEKALKRMGKSFEQSNLAEMDRLWNEAKKKRTR
jgi:uncharacterized protein YabN with tetrapyrrole methylase and pyrophosphatase domain